MDSPLFITFDLPGPGIASEAEAVRLPKLIQGVPYEIGLRVRSPSTGLFRDFSQYDEIRLRLSQQQGAALLREFTASNGQIIGESDRLHLNLTGADTAAIKVPVVNRNAINELRFLHTITLLKDGQEVERLSQGFGYLISAL